MNILRLYNIVYDISVLECIGVSSVLVSVHRTVISIEHLASAGF